MTNEEKAYISTIKTLKQEKDIFKTVIKNLTDKDADENLIAILLNPDVIETLIDPNKYTEALEYVLHAYQQERLDIVREMMLKRYEKKLQGPIEEAKFTSIPTMEVASKAGVVGNEGEAKVAKDSASVFLDAPVNKLEEKEAQIKDVDMVNAPSTANKTVEKGKEEITGSKGYEPSKEEKDDLVEAAKKAEEAFNKPTKAEVIVPEVEIKEETKEEKPRLDSEIHEVKATRKISNFFKEHKKAIYISTGIAALILTIALYPTVLVPTIMKANQVFYAHTTVPAIQTVLHGINTGLGKSIGATFADGLWYTAGGAAITSAAANTCLASAIATYGLWGIYGYGLTKSLKNYYKAVYDKLDDKKESKTEKLFKELDKTIEGKEEKVEVKTENKKPSKTEELFKKYDEEMNAKKESKVSSKEVKREAKSSKTEELFKKYDAEIEKSSAPVEKTPEVKEEPKEEVVEAEVVKPIIEIKPRKIVEEPKKASTTEDLFKQYGEEIEKPETEVVEEKEIEFSPFGIGIKKTKIVDVEYKPVEEEIVKPAKEVADNNIVADEEAVSLLEEFRRQKEERENNGGMRL